MKKRILARELFDGARRRTQAHVITVADGAITSVEPCDDADRAAATLDAADVQAAFVMPGLVEAHAHIFLDGAELDGNARSRYLAADFPTMLATAQRNVARSTRAGITLIRDAGDRYGINKAIRAELRGDPDAIIALRAPGLGVKRPKRYGSFMARDIETAADIAPTIDDLAPDSDDIKIILTGIIDFTAGSVNGAPQFDVDELSQIVALAHSHGRKTFAHCSGLEGLKVAVAAGVDSIEHGFFMTRDILERMADKSIAWVPTFSPVHFQWARPELAGWDAATVTNLRRILDSHSEHVRLAHALRVPLVAGSDAGSQGVDHGAALIDELFHFLDAGVPMDAVLASATSRPRSLWGAPAAGIAEGHQADMVLLRRSPFDDPAALRQVSGVIRGRASFVADAASTREGAAV
jgi:imidazolonepropionase-like amidohydrolase